MASVGNTISEWLKFFLAAGIPASQAANYAVGFVDNRITKDMLSDLNKDYLNDMGITILGDVICILKHAKKAYEEHVGSQSLEAARQIPSPKRLYPGRMIDRYQGGDSKPMTIDDTVLVSDGEPSISPIRKKPTPAPITAPVKAPSPKQLQEVVPVPKRRRVLPEHEGRYKVKLPAGTSPKTAKLLASGKLRSPPDTVENIDGGIFSRLGKNTPPGTVVPLRKTVVLKQASKMLKTKTAVKVKEPTITVTGLGKLDMKHLTTSTPLAAGDSGIFSRLGNDSRRALKRPATSTQPDDLEGDDLEFYDLEPESEEEALYVGVHKNRPGAKRVKIAKIEGQDFGSSRLIQPSAKNRLGASSSTPRTMIKTTASNTKAALQRRLGTTRQPIKAPDDTVSSTSAQVVDDLDHSSSVIVTLKRKPAVRKTVANNRGIFSRLGRR